MARRYYTEMSHDYVSNYAPTANKASDKHSGYYLAKRAFDITITFLLLLALSPLLIAVAILIKVFSKGPVLFNQQRVGLKGEVFDMYKFRSMHINTDDNIHRDFTKNWIANNGKDIREDGDLKVHKIVKDPRIIPFIGHLIRKFSIDELPQLINVIKGEMSLIGPRPSIPYEVEHFKEWHKARFDALPGISGLWQVSGRNKLTFDEMVKLDIKYINQASIKMDLMIAIKTPVVILFDKAY
jgi:lipopolysaccharide/colanic/teichoic acid biosynthesis glycosyltransferase